ncbi:MAG: toprim domain-containing protein [Fusobacterium sp.]|nr:toprim domain-containing protein [Fusobacterium sp.]
MSEKKLREFLEEYLILKGVNTKKNMRCFSKEHEDKHPSMSFYKKANICNCFACGEKYNIFKLVGQEYNLKTKEEQVKKVEELYKNRDLIKNINDSIYSQKGGTVELDYSAKNKEKNYTKSNNSYIKGFDTYYRDCKKRIVETDYLRKRGISKEIENEYNIGYDPNFKNGQWKAIIIPTSHYTFTARNTDENNPDRLRKVGKSHLFGEWLLRQNKESKFYIVEGEIDMLSLAEIGKKSIALGSINNINLFIEKLKELSPKNEFILMLDNDEQGIKAQKELCIKMKELNLNVKETNILGKYKDPNEFLVKDKKGFIEVIEKFERIKKNIKIPKKPKEKNKGNER